MLVATMLGVIWLFAQAPAAPGSGAERGQPDRGSTCGLKRVFGQPFTIRARGGSVSCRKARQLVGRHCVLDPRKAWVCEAYRGDGPFVSWIPTSELFKSRARTEIYLERYPCSRARVTPGLFTSHGRAFPNRRQMLADDIVRGDLVANLTPAAVIALLGPPEERYGHGRRPEFVYWLGPERNSLVQIDPEGLAVEFAGEHARHAEIFQG
jgi:hypothetical protein